MAPLEFKRTVRGALATGLVVAGFAMVPTSTAAADPQTPDTRSSAEQELAALGHQAEVINEQLLGAQVDLEAKHAQQETAERQLATAGEAQRAAQEQQAAFRGTVDTLTAASYQGARLNGLTSLMVSKSPQDVLDQMSGLEILATDTTQRVDRYSAASATAAKAETDARTAAEAAKAAADGAATVQADLQRKQGELATQTAAVRAKYNSLTEAQRVSFAGPVVPEGFVSPVPVATAAPSAPAARSATTPTAVAPRSSASSTPSATAIPGTVKSSPGPVASSAPQPALPAGSSVGAAALQAALSKLGSPYVWGATGPNAFDCSGLTQWAFRQVGVSIPRTADAQAGGGTPVSRDQLQPGDLVFFYSPVSHVGIYAGNGNMVHAPTEGQPVKVAPMSYMPYSGARRY